MAQVPGYSWPRLQLPVLSNGQRSRVHGGSLWLQQMPTHPTGLTVGSNRVLLYVWSQDDITLALDPVFQTLRLESWESPSLSGPLFLQPELSLTCHCWVVDKMGLKGSSQILMPRPHPRSVTSEPGGWGGQKSVFIKQSPPPRDPSV